VAKGLRKVDPHANDEDPDEDLQYYMSLSTAERFRMIVERSILLLQLARKNAGDRETARLTKRR
jgi:hypothetical protein